MHVFGRILGIEDGPLDGFHWWVVGDEFLQNWVGFDRFQRVTQTDVQEFVAHASTRIDLEALLGLLDRGLGG